MATVSVENFSAAEVAHLTAECRARVEAFEAFEQQARKFEAFFTQFLFSQQQQQQQQPKEILLQQQAEFQKYFSEYQTCWTPGHALDPQALLAMLRKLECAVMQFKDQLTNALTKWKTDQALAQIGKPSNADELNPIAIEFSKLDNKVFETTGFVRRLERFANERFQKCNVTQMDQLWRLVLQECSTLASRLVGFRREIQRESFLVFEQPPYIVRRSSGKSSNSSAEPAEEYGSGEDESGGDEKPINNNNKNQSCAQNDDDDEDDVVETKYLATHSRARAQPQPLEQNNKRTSAAAKAAKDSKKEHKVVFDLRVRLMVGDKSLINDSRKVHAILLTDQQCKDLVSRQLTAYDDPLTALAEIGPPVTAASSNGGKGSSSSARANKRKMAQGRRRSTAPGTPPFAAGNLTPYEAGLTYDSALDHFEAFFQNMKVNEKDRNPEAQAQARFYRILFVTKLKDNQSNDFYIWCLSLPFPIVVNATRQERATSAKIFCHLALSTAVVEEGHLMETNPANTSCFHPRQQHSIQSPTSPLSSSLQCPSVGSASGEQQRFMPWNDFFDRLNWWWMKQTGAKNGLHAHERYLASKLGLNSSDSDAYVSLEQVTRKCEGLDFSFWDWLFTIAEYVQKNKDYWNNGFIVGFASKEQVNWYLSTRQEPVMCIRFSDSKLGSLVVCYGMAGKEPQHILLQKKVELKQYKLAYIIEHSKQLVSVNHFATSLDPADPLKHKSEFLQLIASNSSNDDCELQRRGYTKPRLAFDWAEPPPVADFGQVPSVDSYEHDDRSTDGSILEDLLHSEIFDNSVDNAYTYDDLAADPNGFGAALVATTDGPAVQVQQQGFQSPHTAFYDGPMMWNGAGACNGVGARTGSTNAAAGDTPMMQ